MMTSALQGYVFGEPIMKTARNDKPYATFSMIVYQSASIEPRTILVSAVCFKEHWFAPIMALRPEQLIGAYGTMDLGVFRKDNGETVPNVRMMLSGLLDEETIAMLRKFGQEL